jgi:FixJ family two-component response regulator
VVLMTAYGAVALAVEALKRGTADFILKPWRNDKLIAAVPAAADITRSCREKETPNLVAVVLSGRPVTNSGLGAAQSRTIK